MPETYEKESENLEYLKGLTTSEISRWLIDGFTNQDFEGIYHFWKRDYVGANFIHDLWERSTPVVQSSLKDAVAETLEHWDFQQTEEALHAFIYLAAYVREDRVVPSLIGMVGNNLIRDHAEDNGALDTKGTAISVLAGFAPSKEVLEAFEKWFYDPSFDQSHAAQLLVGLMICKPEDGVRYFSRFFEIEKEMPEDTFHLDYLCSIIQSEIGLEKLVRIISDLAPYAKEKMIKQLLENADIERKWRQENPERAAYYDELKRQEKST